MPSTNTNTRETHTGVSGSVMKKLGVYSALGVGGATVAVSVADADIIYTDLRGGNEIIVSTANSARAGIDIDQDGQYEFQISFSTRSPNAFSTSSFRANFFRAPTAPTNNAFIGISFYTQGVSVWNAFSGFAFTQYTDHWYDFGMLANKYASWLTNSSFGYFRRGQPGLALVRFDDGLGEQRFGWIELVHQAELRNGIGADDSFVVTRFAYAIGEPIVAGQTSSIPEPSTMTSIGLLALGAAGIEYRRRRKRAKAAEADSEND